jgi:alkylation response protein AidB-like acyl-CoA dehydrogenase
MVKAMDFDLSEEQAMLRDSAERFVREQYSTEKRRARAASGAGMDRTVWSRFAELGWLALPIAEDCGGLGGSDADVVVLMSALGRGLAIEPYVTSAILCGSLIAGSNWEGRREILRRMAAGELQVAFAHLEPGERVEQAAARATSFHNDGDRLIISGDKILVLDAPSADGFVVTAASPGSTDPALVFVESRREGLTLRDYPLIDGSRAADLQLRDVVVHSSAVLAAGGGAQRLIEEALARATLGYLAQAVGSMEACVELSADYLKKRVQFGQPIARFQVLQHMLVEMLLAAHQARSSLYCSLAHVAADCTSRSSALSSAKVVIGDACQVVSRNGLQLHGGYGITDEFAISHHYRRLMVIEKLFGDPKWHCERLAQLTC